MARVTHVKRAQQRYATKPVLDENGEQKIVAVTRRDGTPKTTKSGKEIVRRLTTEDRTRPLSMPKCDSCGKEIEVGTSYKWIAPKSGPYGGTKRYRHGDCPTWQVWEYNYSLSSQLARIEHEYSDVSACESNDDVTSQLSDAAGEIREIAQEKESGADNIESGFGHETEQSSELREVADQLNSWADEIEEIELPDYPEPEEADCDECEGKGTLTKENPSALEDADAYSEVDCEQCNGTGQHTPDEPTEEQLDEWRQEVDDAVMSVFGNCPV